MANNYTVTLDTTAPGGVAMALDAAATYTTDRDVVCGLTTTDGVTTGYQMKIWGDVDPAYDANVQTLEASSSWITYDPTLVIRVTTGDATKTIYGKVRDDVLNTSGQVSDTITLDTTVPVITIQSGPDVARISKIATKDTVTATWQSDTALQAYKVKVVPATSSLHTAGTQIPSTAGSTNVSGGATPSASNVTTAIKGTDLETASSGDGAKIVKFFGQDLAGNWSV